MRSLAELLMESSTLHGHCCAGQVLGVRMAMAGCREVDIDEPKGCKKLIVAVEMDRCATDAIQAVTGCSLGRRTLKFFDYGKMAATFVNSEARNAVRVVARDDARSLAHEYCPEAANPREAEKRAYAIMPESALFSLAPASAEIAEEDKPGFRGRRVYCDACGEGINFRRELRVESKTLCIPCAREIGKSNRETGPMPPVVLIVGYKKVGKTRALEALVAELSRRGYRLGCVKHHHSDSPVVVDAAGSDTWRFRMAGAKKVALLAPGQVASFYNTEEEMSLTDLLPSLADADLILGEGFHNEPFPKIEVLRSQEQRLCPADQNLIARITLADDVESVPAFAPGRTDRLADFIEAKFLGGPRDRGISAD